MTKQIGRPREFDEAEALERIMSLFWESGYEATGLTQIMKATGLQKGSLYKAFTNKQGMYVKALAHYEKTVVDGAVAFLVSTDAAPAERISSFLSAPIEASCTKKDMRGCFLCNASADYAAHDDETRALVTRGYEKLEHALLKPIAALQPKWTVERQESTARLCLSVYAGLRTMSRAAIERQRLEGARDACMDMLR